MKSAPSHFPCANFLYLPLVPVVYDPPPHQMISECSDSFVVDPLGIICTLIHLLLRPLYMIHALIHLLIPLYMSHARIHLVLRSMHMLYTMEIILNLRANDSILRTIMHMSLSTLFKRSCCSCFKQRRQSFIIWIVWFARCANADGEECNACISLWAGCICCGVNTCTSSKANRFSFSTRMDLVLRRLPGEYDFDRTLIGSGTIRSFVIISF